jgi:DNA-binding beta-propeller fold protein YncE
MQLTQTIPLSNVSGRIDHLAADVKGQRMFVAALGNNSVEVIDLKAGKVVHSISGLSEPQGVLFIPELNKLFVANGGDGRCLIFDGSTFAAIGGVDLPGDADNLRYDSNSLAVVVGYGDGGLSFIDAQSGKVLTDIKLDGHPESFQLESSGSRVFINIPSANQIAVAERGQPDKIEKWSLGDASANYPMALEERQYRLFVGFRSPAKLNVYDTETGKLVVSLDTVEDVDDIFYDALHKMIYVVGGEGYVDVFSQKDLDHYQHLTRLPTRTGARTGLWVPEENKLYIAVPQQGTQPAAIQVYELQQ